MNTFKGTVVKLSIKPNNKYIHANTYIVYIYKVNILQGQGTNKQKVTTLTT